MYFDKKKFINLHNINIDFDIKGVSQSSNIKNNTISFALNVDDSLINSLKASKSVVIFLPLKTELPHECQKNNLLINCINPRYEYIKTTRLIFKRDPIETLDHHNYIHPTSKVSKTATIDPFTYIGANCEIGEDCIISTGVKILDNVVIGQGTRIGPNTVIGAMGFGFERDNGKERQVIGFGGDPLKMPHFGGVIIGDNCDIGSLTTVCAGAIEPTILEDYVMVDDHVHIAHNCKIGRGASLAACAEVSGSVEVGSETWISPNTSIMQKISIGPRSIIGIGAVVLKSSPPDSILIGNPAKPIRKNHKKDN